MYRKHVWTGLTVFMLAGCQAPVRPEVDGLVCASASRPVDLAPGAVLCKILPPVPAERLAVALAKTLPMPTSLPPIQEAASRGQKTPNTGFDNLLLISAQEPKGADQAKKLTTLETRLQVPPGVPGANVPPI